MKSAYLDLSAITNASKLEKWRSRKLPSEQSCGAFEVILSPIWFQGKKFLCQCRRCADPTSLSTFGDSLLCRKCKFDAKTMKGCVLKTSAGNWKCNQVHETFFINFYQNPQLNCFIVFFYRASGSCVGLLCYGCRRCGRELDHGSEGSEFNSYKLASSFLLLSS